MDKKQFLKCKVILQIEYLKLKYGSDYQFKDDNKQKIPIDEASNWAEMILKKLSNHIN